MKNFLYKNKVLFATLVILASFASASVAHASFLGDLWKKVAGTGIVGGGTNTITSLPVKTFLGLTDTPNTYVGQGTKVVSVNAGETALEFTTVSAGITVGTTVIGSSTDNNILYAGASGILSQDQNFIWSNPHQELVVGASIIASDGPDISPSSSAKLKIASHEDGSLGGTHEPVITFTDNTGTNVARILGNHLTGYNGDLYLPSTSGTLALLSDITSSSPGGSSGQIQYNNAGAFGGIPGFTTDGVTTFFGSNILKLNGATSGTTTLNSGAVAGTSVITLPVATDTLVGKATTDTFTNKTFDTAGTGNSFSINGTGITAVTGTGSVVLATSPTLTTPTIGVATATSINKVAVTAPATSATLTIADGKTLTSSNTITLAGTDGKGINIGATTSGKILVGDGSNMVLSTPTFPNASATTGKIIKSDGTNWVASTETYAAPGTNKNVMKSDGTNWTSAAPTFEGLVEAISFQDAGTSIAATTYVLELYAEYAYTINEMRIISGAGTVTANLKIGSTSVTSCSAVSVTTTITSCTASGANTVAVGDKITLVTTSNSGLNDLQATIKTTRN